MIDLSLIGKVDRHAVAIREQNTGFFKTLAYDRNPGSQAPGRNTELLTSSYIVEAIAQVRQEISFINLASREHVQVGKIDAAGPLDHEYFYRSGFHVSD